LELHREDLFQHGQVLLGELLLQVDGVRGEDRLLLVRHGIEDRRHQVGQALADAGASLDREVFAVFQSPRHRDRHLLLLGAELEIRRSGQNAFGREYLSDLLDKVLA
jgi:hypothetical protein